MQDNRSRHRLMLVGVLVALFAISASASSVSAVSMQDEEPKGQPLSSDNPTLYFYGEQDNSQTHDQWETWNHAGQTDSDSDSSFSEANPATPGDPNGGGGNRIFTFEGSAPATEKILINSEEPMTGIIDLSINTQSGSQQVRVTMSVGQKQYVSVTLNEQNKNDDGMYEFSLDSSLKQLEIGESISLKLEFTKPSGFSDGYSLYLGRDAFEMTVPVLPPEEVIIPPSETGPLGEYMSPYANSSNQFTKRDVPGQSSVAPYIWGAVSLVLIIPAGMFIPNLGIFKPIGISLLSVGMLTTLCVVPVITSLDSPAETDIGSCGVADYCTPDMLASLDDSTGEFLAGIPPATTFKLYVTYDQIHTSNVDGVVGVDGQSTPTSTKVTGLGFEDYSEMLSDNTTTTQRGNEKLQLFFSLIDGEVDLQPGHAVIINATFVERCAGCAEVVPQWAVWVDDQNLADGVRMGIMPGDQTPRFIIPASAVEVINVDPTWGGYPLMIGLPLALAAFGFGGWQLKVARDEWMLEQYSDDDDLELDEDEFDDVLTDDDFV